MKCFNLEHLARDCISQKSLAFTVRRLPEGGRRVSQGTILCEVLEGRLLW